MKLSLRLLPLLVLLAASACNKEECFSGDKTIREYLATDSVGTATAYLFENGDTSGMYYQILSAGDTVTPTVSDTVVFTYEGTTTTPEQFDQSTTPLAFALSDLIVGWQYGLPLIGQGGSIRMFIPANLGYGSNQAGDICPNTDLIFTVNLQEVRR